MVIEYLRNVTSPNWNTCHQIIIYFHTALYCCLPQLRVHWKDSLQYFLQNRSIVVMNSLSFYLSWKVLTSLFLRTVLPYTVFLVDSFFFLFLFLSVVWIYYFIPFWTARFLLWNPLVVLWKLPLYVINHFTLAAFKILSLSLTLCVLRHSVTQVLLFATWEPGVHQAPLPMEFSRQEYCNLLLLPLVTIQGILLIQGSNPCLLYLLYCRKSLYDCTTREAPLTLHSLITLCLSMVFCGYFLVYFFELIESLHFIPPSDKLSAPFSCSSFVIPIIWVRSTWQCHINLIGLFAFFFFFFLSFAPLWMISNDLSSSSLILSSAY